MLPFLHDGCGEPGQPVCDHPAVATSLTAFGSCGDCHAAATFGVEPGAIDLARVHGLGLEEGVTCDLCHKTRAVTPGPAPGLDGALQLQRPSEPTTVAGQEFDPITFGPYPDVIVPIMKGSYAPQMRQAEWCSACHEYARTSLRPDHAADPARWPAGLPILETHAEYLARSDEHADETCQTCHMPVLEEESSTYDLSEFGLFPSLAQGWWREPGEVRRHEFVPFADMDPPQIAVTLAEVDGAIEAAVTVTNSAAGHALPTGAPIRQVIVLVEAIGGDGQPVAATGGHAIPDVGGARFRGEVGNGMEATGAQLVFAVAPPTDVETARFVRPGGVWDDHDGPGTSTFDGMTPEEKGLPVHEVLGVREVIEVEGGVVTLASLPPDLQASDIVYLASGADAAGAPGWLYAKILVDRDGVRGAHHHRAVDIASDNRIASGALDTSLHRFVPPAAGDPLTVTATLVYRRQALDVATRYGWEASDTVIAEATAVWE